MRLIILTLALNFAGLFIANGVVAVNHPSIPLYDSSGQLIYKSGMGINFQKTCGGCHDTEFIGQHSSHPKVSCFSCHLGEGELSYDKQSFEADGKIKKDFLKLQSPSNNNCGQCHYVAYEGKSPLRIPDSMRKPEPGRPVFSLTETTGEIISSQPIAESALNLKNKDDLHQPWDIHAARGVKCIDCHFSANNPKKAYLKNSDLEHLGFDPRQPSVGEYMWRPSHRLQTSSCETCHEPLKVHHEFPYKQRHLEVLECQSCHVPQTYGPTLKSISLKGERVLSKEFMSDARAGENKDNLNLHYLEANKPLLMAYVGEEGQSKIGPFNSVEIIDSSQSGRVTTTALFPVRHGIMYGKKVIRDCNYCHGKNSELGSSNFIKYVAAKDETHKGITNSFQMQERKGTSAHYIFGTTRINMIEIFGWLLVAMTLFAAGAHGYYRYYSLKKSKVSYTAVRTKMVYMYSVYERIWHWITAVGIILLMFTGFEIHYAGRFVVLGLKSAVQLHNILALILIINAFLSLFYHIASAEIKKFLPPMRSFVSEAVAQIRYYSGGIFRGEPHPMEKTPERKMNVLQQLTYLGLLNLLLPAQVITGILIFGIERWPELSAVIGGLKYIGPIHAILAWMFLSFLIMHVYLTTTGHRINSYIKAMITGYDEIETRK